LSSRYLSVTLMGKSDNGSVSDEKY